MNVVSDPRPVSSADAQPTENATFRNHPAFCQLALPIRASKGIWRRDVGAASVTIEAGASLDSDGEHRDVGLSIPTGKYARLLMMHICNAALQADSPVVELGTSAGALAESFGLDIKGPKLREFTDQLDRILAARITVSLEGGLALAMFDARGRTRGGAPGWRSSVRLNSKFFAALSAHAVTLDRRVVATLADTPMALDAYAWVSFLLPGIEAGAEAFASWDDLMTRFAPASQQPDEFRAAFEQSLRQVSELSPHLSLVIREQGVECRISTRRLSQTTMVAPVPAAPAIEQAPPPEIPEAPPAAPPAMETEMEIENDMAREIAAEIASSLVTAPAVPVAAPPAVPVAAPPRPVPSPVARDAAQEMPREAGQEPPREAARDIPRQTISLKSHLTGLTQVIWLQRSNGRDNLVIEVTPGGRYDPDNVTVLALEPMILQIAGGLHARDFERVAAWANANRDLIDEFWEGSIDSFEEITSRVKKVPPPGWR